MAMFEEDELNEINIEELLGVDIQKLKEMKNKLGKIINYVENVDGEKKEVINMLKEKEKQIEKNIDNIKNVESNVENIDKIIYGENETKVMFQLK